MKSTEAEMKYLHNPPFIIKKLFSSYQWESKLDKILLTFDDGPVPGTTERILKKLSDLNLKAVFFCVGDNVQKYPELAKSILNEGHIIGNHTFNHKRVTETEREETVLQIQLFNLYLLEKFNYTVKYFRPPYGKFNLSTAGIVKDQKLKSVMWSLITYDWENNFEVVRNSVDNYLGKNSIAVLHDNPKSSSIITDSIQYLVDAAAKRGFQTGTPAECLI